MRFAVVWSLAFSLLVACSPALVFAEDGAIQGKQTIPLTTVVFSGHRYLATADFGIGAPVPLMIHGNAGMFLMLTHEVGARVNGGPIKQTEAYGYSSRGKGTIDVPRMRLGTQRFSNLQKVPVFDFTEEGPSPAQGMVGVPFLVAARAAVDFSRDVMILGVKRSATPNKQLLAEGYKYVRLTIGTKVTIPARFPSLDSTVTITPSTVSTALTLHHSLFAGKIPMRADTTGPDRSPSRTSPAVFLSDGVNFELAGVPLKSPASLEDFAEYANVPASQINSVGLLGFDWMKAHSAVIDYANRYLYFRP